MPSDRAVIRRRLGISKPVQKTLYFVDINQNSDGTLSVLMRDGFYYYTTEIPGDVLAKATTAD